MDTIIHNLAVTLFSISCHQQIQLLLMVDQELLPLCVRCGYIYLGVVVAYIWDLLVRGKRLSWRFGTGCISLLFVEWGLANFWGYSSSDFSRAVTGFIGGFGVMQILWSYGKLVHNLPVLIGLLLSSIVLLYSVETGVLIFIIFGWTVLRLEAINTFFQIVQYYKQKGTYYEVQKNN